MKIIVSDSFKNVAAAILEADLQAEIEYHVGLYGQPPAKIHILKFIEMVSKDAPKYTKSTMVLGL